MKTMSETAAAVRDARGDEAEGRVICSRSLQSSSSRRRAPAHRRETNPPPLRRVRIHGQTVPDGGEVEAASIGPKICRRGTRTTPRAHDRARADRSGFTPAATLI
jgi:hypothetical protein